jgi:hypothetical protein
MAWRPSPRRLANWLHLLARGNREFAIRKLLDPRGVLWLAMRVRTA